MDILKSMFPDADEAYLRNALSSGGGNVEVVIDRLLTNPPPAKTAARPPAPAPAPARAPAPAPLGPGEVRVSAPAGKLGVHFADVDDEAVVAKLNDTSPINGIMKPGDRISSVNGTNTKGMNKATLAQVVAGMAQEMRVFVVARTPDPASAPARVCH